MVGPTWPRVRFTLGSDCLPVLSQGTASLRLDYGLTASIVTARIRCLVIGVVLLRFTYLLLMRVGARFHGALYPMTGCVLYLDGLLC